MLGESDMTFYAESNLASRVRKAFPQSLNGAPMLLPSMESVLRPALDRWMNKAQIHPVAVGQFDDMALLQTFGENGAGVFPVPTVIAGELTR